jgi:hypothetical protein
MTAHHLKIDHLFMFIESDGPEIDALRRQGFTETYRRAHPGQGTAKVCFAFDNLYLELLWLTSEAEARSGSLCKVIHSQSRPCHLIQQRPAVPRIAGV